MSIPIPLNPLSASPYLREVEYLESTGTQYIDTGVKPDFMNGDSIKISFFTPAGSLSHFGSRYYSGTYKNSAYNIGDYIVFYGSSGSGADITWDNYAGKHTLSMDDTNIIDNGSILAAVPIKVTVMLPFFLFAFNENGQPHPSIASGMKLYEWKYYQNGVLAQHLIPVLDKSGVPCMYDIVSGQLFYNQGTGQFQYAELPYSARLEYLAVAQSGQYIITDYEFDARNKGSSLEIKFYMPSDMDLNKGIFGARAMSSAADSLYCLGRNLVVGGESDYQAYNVFATGADNVLTFEDGKFSVNGSAETDTGRLPAMTGYAFDLFNMNLRGNHGFASSVGTRIYYCKFFENGSLVRNFIPVLDRYGVPCMFDTVTKNRFYNAGTGTLNYKYDPLTFTAFEESTIKIIKTGSPNVQRLQYDIAGEWHDYEIDTVIHLSEGQSIKFQNIQSTLSTSNSDYVQFVMTGTIGASGNMQSMLNYSDTCPSYGFRRIFQNCASLIKAPDFLATSAGQYAYASSLGKTSITNVPKISALSLSANCCYYMFEDCPITKAPDLPATSVESNVYDHMFYNCKKLIKGPEIYVTTIDGNDACKSMFEGCSEMIEGPSVLPATTLKNGCYNSMFKYCNKLINAPVLPATTLIQNCYNDMFTGCESLKRLEVNFSTWTSGCTTYWLSEINSNDGTFICPSGLDTTTRDSSHILSGWTVVTK